MFQTGSEVSKQYLLDFHTISITIDLFRGVFGVEVLILWCYEADYQKVFSTLE